MANAPTYSNPGGTETDAVGVVLIDPTTGEPYAASGGGGGGAGDASAANQTTQIDHEANMVTALQIMDDWDESDRAKVNIIAGQVGVQGGSGVVTALTQRVALATDVALPAGEAHIGAVGGHTIHASANFTRPADTNVYASGDLVANNTTAGSVTPMSFTVGRGALGLGGMIRRARMRKTGTGITNASFRLHLYSASPTVTNGDNGAWLSNQAANYIGAVDITVDKAFSDGAAGNGAPNVGSELNFVSDTVFGLLEARGAYTPASAEVNTLILEVLQN